MYDIIIIGAGPAGMTAAIYAKRANKKVLLLEGNAYGGQIVNAADIENFPALPHISGFELATKMYEQVKQLGVEVKFEKVETITEAKEVITNKSKYESKTIIICSGTKHRKLGLESETELIGKGVSYCATCDGAFYKDKDVAVVGSGNTALEDALYLSNLAKKVYLINRSENIRGDMSTYNKLTNLDNVEILLNSKVTKLNYEDVLTSIELSDKTLEVSGLFIAIGQEPDCLFDIVEKDQNGYIVSDEKCHTNIDGIFVAGDIRTKKLRQLVTATSDGAIAAKEAVNYINNIGE